MKEHLSMNQIKLLRIAFILGAVTDAFALLPMIFPKLANIFWGFFEFNGSYQFAMGYGASLMLGWTVFLIWAAQKPIERKYAAILTMIVIFGFVVTEIVCVLSGFIAIEHVVVSWIMQAILFVLFSWAYFYPKVQE